MNTGKPNLYNGRRRRSMNRGFLRLTTMRLMQDDQIVWR